MMFSVQKSVMLLHAAFEAEGGEGADADDEVCAVAWAENREAVEAAIWAGSNAMLAYMAEHAGYSRLGHHGGAAGGYVDAHDLSLRRFSSTTLATTTRSCTSTTGS